MVKINLAENFNLFNDYWSPRDVGELNGHYVKLAKFKGEFIWHSHANEDELLVSKGVEHKPSAEEEAHIMLLEPKSTEQTGGIESDLFVDKQPWI